MDTQKTQKINIEPPKWIVEALDADADNTNISRKSLIHTILKDYVEQQLKINIQYNNKNRCSH